ncbi:MAG TPA: hypothetical protein VEU47_16850 [Candidatus Cybelea sp.]|nr:hypothetical protein [Candidatus Cybelea sp.]
MRAVFMVMIIAPATWFAYGCARLLFHWITESWRSLPMAPRDEFALSFLTALAVFFALALVAWDNQRRQ